MQGGGLLGGQCWTVLEGACARLVVLPRLRCTTGQGVQAAWLRGAEYALLRLLNHPRLRAWPLQVHTQGTGYDESEPNHCEAGCCTGCRFAGQPFADETPPQRPGPVVPCAVMPAPRPRTRTPAPAQTPRRPQASLQLGCRAGQLGRFVPAQSAPSTPPWRTCTARCSSTTTSRGCRSGASARACGRGPGVLALPPLRPERGARSCKLAGGCPCLLLSMQGL